MERREFLQQVAAWSVVAGTIPTLRIPSVSAQTTAPGVAAAQPELIVGKGKDYAELTRKVVEKLGGMQKFVKAGDKVVVKPNIGWDRTVEQGANTHPEIVKALVVMALAAGAKQVLVFDRSCDDTRKCYAKSGIKEAIEGLNDPRATCPYCDNAKFVPVKIDNGVAIQTWNIYKDALDADVYINVPIAKHHSSAKVTAGLKNIMGVAGGNRGSLHQNQGEKLTDLHLVIKPKLTIIDATRILLRNGPQGGKMEDVKVLDTIVASTDPVAADAYVTQWFDKKPDEIPIILAASKRGLGEIDLAKVKVTEV